MLTNLCNIPGVKKSLEGSAQTCATFQGLKVFGGKCTNLCNISRIKKPLEGSA